MANPENIGIYVGIALLSSVETEIIVLPFDFWFKAAILNIPLPFIQENVQENMVEFSVSQSNKNVACLV